MPRHNSDRASNHLHVYMFTVGMLHRTDARIINLIYKQLLDLQIWFGKFSVIFS